MCFNAIRRIAPDKVHEHAVRGQYSSGTGKRGSKWLDIVRKKALILNLQLILLLLPNFILITGAGRAFRSMFVPENI